MISRHLAIKLTFLAIFSTNSCERLTKAWGATMIKYDTTGVIVAYQLYIGVRTMNVLIICTVVTTIAILGALSLNIVLDLFRFKRSSKTF